MRTCPFDLYLAFVVLSMVAMTSPADAELSCARESSTLLSQNPTFELGTDGWGVGSSVTSQLLTRDWTPGTFPLADYYESANDLGAKLVELSGVGSWRQTIALTGTNRQQILNAYAYCEAIDQTKSLYAEIEVSYFNATGQRTGGTFIPIDDRRLNLNRGIGDGLNFYAWGLSVPAAAKSVSIGINCSVNTRVFIDQFSLFDYFMQPPSPVSKSLITHGTIEPRVNGGARCLLYGIEFWQGDLDFGSGVLGFLGSPLQPELIYQFVPVKPGRTYTLIGQGDKFGFGSLPASFGIDFYDSNWQRIGSTDVNLFGLEIIDVARSVTVPANAAHASVFAWCDQLPTVPPYITSGLKLDLYLLEQESSSLNRISVIAYDKTFRGGKGGTLGAGIVVAFRDPDGIDLDSIDASDAYYTSRTIPTKTYPASVYTKSSDDGGKLALVEYFASASDYADAGFLVIRANQVRDTLGNFAAKKTFGPVLLGQ